MQEGGRVTKTVSVCMCCDAGSARLPVWWDGWQGYKIAWGGRALAREPKQTAHCRVGLLTQPDTMN
jgi:hypothetical protein